MAEAPPPRPVRQNLTPQQRLEALRRVQAQAEKRVELGKRLFEAAEQRIKAEQTMLSEVRAEQQALREKVHEEFTRSLHAYDQWIGQIDESFTHAIQALERKIDAVAAQSQADRQAVEAMTKRAEALLRSVQDAAEASRRGEGSTPTSERGAA